MNIARSMRIPDLEELAILLDIDGTILDIASTPGAVTVPSSLRQTLVRLSERTAGALALVSGRSMSDIDRLFAPLQLPAVAGHGAEFRPVPGAETDHSLASGLDSSLRRQLATVADRSAGVIVEDKGYSLALHYRLAPERESEVRQAVARICANDPSIEILPGKSVVEIKPAGFSKATRVRELMTYPAFAGRRPIFIGDDKTDESVFAIMPEFGGVAFSVGKRFHGVDGCFDEPDAVRQWLAAIARNGESVPQ
jgi:trehalose 6-phosphate phosphatase